MGSTKSKPKFSLTSFVKSKLGVPQVTRPAAMSGLNLKATLDDEGPIDSGPGRFADERALAVLERYFQNEIHLDKAAEEITGMLPNMTDRSRRWDIYRLSYFLSDIACQIPYSHPAQTLLVRLIERISHSPKLMGLGGPPLGDDVPCYTMDLFKMHLCEEFCSSTGVDEEEPDAISHDINSAAFLARLSTSGFLGNSPTWFIWTMRSAFEMSSKDLDETEELEDESKELSDRQKGFDGCVSMAALWVILAGQVMYSYIVEAPEPEEGRLHAPGELYHGPTLGLTRWMFWRDAFYVAAEKKASSDNARTLAYSAANMMDAIADSMKF